MTVFCVEQLEGRCVLSLPPMPVAELGLPGSATPVGVAADARGNFYITGWFDGSVDFNPRRNRALVLQGRGAYLARYGAGGDLDWAIALRDAPGTVGMNNIRALATDARGDVYLSGAFSGRPTQDGGTGGWLMPGPSTNQRSTLWKFRRDGSFSFANDLPVAGDRLTTGSHVADDRFGSIYTTETTSTPVGDGRYEFGASLAKYDDSGRRVWARSAGSSFPDVVVIDRQDNPWIAATRTSESGDDDYVATKFNGRGRVVDALTVARGSATFGAAGLAFDAADNLVVAGGFVGRWDLDPGTGVRRLEAKRKDGYADVFLAKYSPDHRLIFAHQIGGRFSDAALAFGVDRDGTSWVSGRFAGAVDFDPTRHGRFVLEASGAAGPSQAQVFVARYDSAGRFRSARTLERPVRVDMVTGAAITAGHAIVLVESSPSTFERRSTVLWRLEGDDGEL